jgi:hypothetical protein
MPHAKNLTIEKLKAVTGCRLQVAGAKRLKTCINCKIPVCFTTIFVRNGVLAETYNLEFESSYYDGPIWCRKTGNPRETCNL